ncbi:hypothetical protein JCM33374_g3831 [Metschnikowia sp. JCM 33374]|nr:hypothetical protein JCM33374_g3831 [Metschnikowia sp. JCM 33374]
MGSQPSISPTAILHSIMSPVMQGLQLEDQNPEGINELKRISNNIYPKKVIISRFKLQEILSTKIPRQIS